MVRLEAYQGASRREEGFWTGISLPSVLIYVLIYDRQIMFYCVSNV
jgi:hypothetical protein